MRSGTKKKEEIALKARTENEEELDDDDMALFTKKVKQFLNNNSMGRKGELSTQQESFNCLYHYPKM